MRIGDFTIWPLVDGEISSDPSLLYRNRDDRAWAPYDHFLDPCTGNYLSTVGGFLIRGGGRTVVLDAGIGSHPVYPWLGGGFRFNPHGPGFNAARMRSKNPSVCIACHGRVIPGL